MRLTDYELQQITKDVRSVSEDINELLGVRSRRDVRIGLFALGKVLACGIYSASRDPSDREHNLACVFSYVRECIYNLDKNDEGADDDT